jgi:hypothetical protein
MSTRKRELKPTPEAIPHAKSTTRQRRFKIVKLEERIAPSATPCQTTRYNCGATNGGLR